MPAAPAPAAVDVHAEAVERYRRERRDARNGWVFVTVLCSGIWLITAVAGDGPGFFWPVFPSAGVGIGLLTVVLNREARIEAHEERVVERRQMRREL